MALTQLKRRTLCRLGYHDWSFLAVVVRTSGLMFSKLLPAELVAKRRCIHCPAESEALYVTKAILQKPKELGANISRGDGAG